MDHVLMDLCTTKLKIDEGFRGFPYKDSVGVLTIGYGHNLEAKPLTEDQAEDLLREDILDVEIELADLDWYRDLEMERQYVILNMAFNLGVPRLLKFKNTIAAIKRKDWEEAAAQMLMSKWAIQVGSRAYRLAEIMLTGDVEW